MNKLLAILDMDSDHQFWTIQKYLSPENAELYDTQEISLADLAFQLRDEDRSVLGDAEKEIGRFHVFAHCNNKSYEWTEEHCELVDSWFVEWGKPIQWIIAILIAKEPGIIK